MTPLDVEILLHFHVSAAPFPRADAPACVESIAMLRAQGMIEPAPCIIDAPSYRTTEKGRAHVVQICNLEFPRQAWVGGDGKLIS